MFLIEIPPTSLRVFCIWKAKDLQILNVSRSKEGKFVAIVLDTIFNSKN